MLRTRFTRQVGIPQDAFASFTCWNCF